MLKFNKDELEILYAKYGSIRKISEGLNIPKSTLEYCFHKHNINISKRLKVTKSDLERLYKELGSAYKVAERLGEQPSSVYYYLNKYNIDINRNRFPYTKEELVVLYSKYGSIVKIAAALSKPYSTVRYWYSELSIPIKKSGMTIFHEVRNTPMEATQKDVLIGSMLGDGGFWLAPHCKNARLYISHCEKQLGYLKWIHGLLQPFSRPITQIEKAGKKTIGDSVVNCSNFYRFYTIAHPDITEVFHKYYKNGLKSVDSTIIDRVNLLAMCIWFGDDGSIRRDRRGHPISCSIASNSFTYKEQLILIEIVRNFFKGTIRIAEQGGYYMGNKRTDYYLDMGGKNHVEEFLDIVKFVLPECIHYKLT